MAVKSLLSGIYSPKKELANTTAGNPAVSQCRLLRQVCILIATEHYRLPLDLKTICNVTKSIGKLTVIMKIQIYKWLT